MSHPPCPEDHDATAADAEDEELIRGYEGELFNARADCVHEIVGEVKGVACRKCGGWFLY